MALPQLTRASYRVEAVPGLRRAEEAVAGVAAEVAAVVGADQDHRQAEEDLGRLLEDVVVDLAVEVTVLEDLEADRPHTV